MKQLLLIALLFSANNFVQSQSINVNGPAGSGQFGSSVTMLANGNYVVTDPSYDDGAIIDAGAVHLYNGNTHVLISTLKGSAAGNQVGSNGITALSNGNFVVVSMYWDNGAVTNVGAVTWGDGNTGISGVINSSNSLVGSTTNDLVGYGGVTALNNGNYVVKSENWDNGAASNAGAVTFGSGTSGISGVVSSSNSLVSITANSFVGNGGVTALSNGNYVVRSAYWSNAVDYAPGAVSFGNGTSGISGVISSSNSLVGSTANDNIGRYGVTALANGNYVISSPNWDNGAAWDAGAVSFGSGTSGISGLVSSSNSLVGSSSNDLVGNYTITLLTNGNYVVISPNWNNAGIWGAGAVSFGSGISGITGVVSSSNSLVGNTTDNNVGIGGVTALTNGNYVVNSFYWDNGAAINAGAVTFGSGTTGRTGVVSSINSLIGGPVVSFNMVGYYGITALSNGNYVVNSPYWDNGAAADAGAVTFGSGTTGISGLVSSSNSLVGSTATNEVGNGGVTALNNGNYVVNSRYWDNGAATNAGAVTFCNGTTGRSGGVTSANSLVGSMANNTVGLGGVTALSNGNYVVRSHNWDNGAATDAGAVTFGSGTSGISGVVSSTNSLVGTTANDNVGSYGITPLTNGNYVVKSGSWDNGATINAGAVSFGNGTTGLSGVVSNINSLVGGKPNDNIGEGGVTVLNDGNYVVDSYLWDNGAASNAGAVSFGSGTTGLSGMVTSLNSLVGSSTNDAVGNGGVTALGNASYMVKSMMWDDGATVEAGAITWGNAGIGVTGTITTCNSVIGTTFGGGSLNSAYNTTYDYLMVGRPADNLITVYKASGMAIANSLDATAVNINGTNAVPLIVNTGCRIIATLVPNGANPVNGTVSAKAWIETIVPTHSGRPYVARHFEINPASNPSTATAKITLYFTQQEFTNFNAHAGSALDLPTGTSDVPGKANLRIGKYAGTSSDGSGLPATYSGTAEVIDPNDADIVWNNSLSRWEVSFDVTGFGAFIVQTYSFVLPLTLLEFTGRLHNNNAVLNWKTTNEFNTHFFDIERSTNGITYTAIGNVAAWNTAGDHQYNFTDNNINLLEVQVVYYRLKQKDIDGRFTHSNIITLSIDGIKSMVLLYPNPVTTEANLTITVDKNQQLHARIIDNAGRAGKQIQRNIIAGTTTWPLEVKGLAPGVYFLELKGETINERKKFIKQ